MASFSLSLWPWRDNVRRVTTSAGKVRLVFLLLGPALIWGGAVLSARQQEHQPWTLTSF